MNLIPYEIKIYFICFQNFKSEMLKMRLINKEFKLIMDKKVSLPFYPEPTNESLTNFCLLYKIFMYEKKLQEEEAHKEFEKMNIDMLIENGWI